MRCILILSATLVALAVTQRECRAARGDEVVVVYNSAMPESKTVADYYAMRREVPKSHVFGFELSTNEAVTRADFRDSLQLPLLQKLESTKLWTFGTGTIPNTNGDLLTIPDKLLESQIRYAVLCYGVPLRIAEDPTLKAPGVESIRPEFRRNEASVDTELACLPTIYQHMPLTGPLRNAFYTVTNSALMQPTNGVLMVTRLDGPSADIARGLVDKAMEAETNGWWGRAYIDLRNIPDVAFKPGDEWIRAAEGFCRLRGFETTVDNNPATFPASFPMSQIGFYAGWYDVNASGPFTLKNVEFMPGAFAYHLHSYSAATLRSTTQNWVGPFLAEGVTATMGCVSEPYLGGTPDVGVFAGRFLYYDFTFGESAYASQPVLSWQTTFVGDPLYSPFLKNPIKLHLELQARHSKFLEWSQVRIVNVNALKGVPLSQQTSYIEQLDLTASSAVLSEKLADLCIASGKPSSAIFAYEQALKDDPSPQQRVRLRLNLGERLLEAHKDKDAYEDYKKLLEEWPDHPCALSVCEKLLPLAKKLGKTDDATKWEEEIKRLTPPPPAPPVAPTNNPTTATAPPPAK